MFPVFFLSAFLDAMVPTGAGKAAAQAAELMSHRSTCGFFVWLRSFWCTNKQTNIHISLHVH